MRIITISDTHGKHRELNIPYGDVQPSFQEKIKYPCKIHKNSKQGSFKLTLMLLAEIIRSKPDIGYK